MNRWVKRYHLSGNKLKENYRESIDCAFLDKSRVRITQVKTFRSLDFVIPQRRLMLPVCMCALLQQIAKLMPILFKN